jgi:hypothetical protein
LYELEASICKALRVLCLALNNAEDGSLRLARRVKSDEKKIDYHPI